MFIIETVPLTKIPLQKSQILSYFSTHDLEVGSLVSAPLGRRQEKAIVVETHEIKEHKMEIKEAEYELKPLKKIISRQALVTQNQIRLVLWLGQYYFASPGLFLKMMIKKVLPLRGISRREKSYNTEIKIDKKQKLILIPTISQIGTTIKKNSQNKFTIIHSGLKAGELSKNWQKIARGETEIIIGTRLAVFAPFANLKEIIIEDETNSNHRSFDMFPHYRVHEAAKKLAEISQAKLIFKSQAPSVEAYCLAKQKQSIFKYIPPPFLKEERLQVQIVDLRQELKDGNFSIFSRQLQSAISETLKNGQQVILFINRRGLATFVLCRDCGYVAKCPNCEAPLTYHLIRSNDGLKPMLICHHCGQKINPPSVCPKCQSYRIKAFGSGTQRVEIEAKKLFKETRVLRLDSDVAKSPEAKDKIIQEFAEKKAGILIGTQIILKRNLPKVPLAAFVSADTLLHLPDFCSGERLWQTIQQIKSFVQEKLIIQTYNPENSVIAQAAKNDYRSFLKEEVDTREILKYPPFSQLIKLTFRHEDPKKAATEAKILFVKLTQQLKISKIFKEIIFELIGPAPAFIPKEKQKYIWRIIVKSVSPWLASEPERQKIIKLRNKFLMIAPFGWEVNVDPESLL